jgi:hypothetical protein
MVYCGIPWRKRRAEGPGKAALCCEVESTLGLASPEVTQCAAEGKSAAEGQTENDHGKTVNAFFTPAHMVFGLRAERRFAPHPDMCVFNIRLQLFDQFHTSPSCWCRCLVYWIQNTWFRRENHAPSDRKVRIVRPVALQVRGVFR